MEPWNWAWGGCKPLPAGCLFLFLPKQSLAKPWECGRNKSRDSTGSKPWDSTGIIKSFSWWEVFQISPFASNWQQGWIWMWWFKISWRKSSWEVTEPRALACPVKLSTWNLGKGKYLRPTVHQNCAQKYFEKSSVHLVFLLVLFCFLVHFRKVQFTWWFYCILIFAPWPLK